jgi:hypothetical protein
VPLIAAYVRVRRIGIIIGIATISPVFPIFISSPFTLKNAITAVVAINNQIHPNAINITNAEFAELSILSKFARVLKITNNFLEI